MPMTAGGPKIKRLALGLTVCEVDFGFVRHAYAAANHIARETSNGGL